MGVAAFFLKLHVVPLSLLSAVLSEILPFFLAFHQCSPQGGHIHFHERQLGQGTGRTQYWHAGCTLDTDARFYFSCPGADRLSSALTRSSPHRQHGNFRIPMAHRARTTICNCPFGFSVLRDSHPGTATYPVTRSGHWPFTLPCTHLCDGSQAFRVKVSPLTRFLPGQWSQTTARTSNLPASLTAASSFC